MSDHKIESHLRFFFVIVAVFVGGIYRVTSAQRSAYTLISHSYEHSTFRIKFNTIRKTHIQTTCDSIVLDHRLSVIFSQHIAMNRSVCCSCSYECIKLRLLLSLSYEFSFARMLPVCYKLGLCVFWLTLYIHFDSISHTKSWTKIVEVCAWFCAVWHSQRQEIQSKRKKKTSDFKHNQFILICQSISER